MKKTMSVKKSHSAVSHSTRSGRRLPSNWKAILMGVLATIASYLVELALFSLVRMFRNQLLTLFISLI